MHVLHLFLVETLTLLCGGEDSERARNPSYGQDIDEIRKLFSRASVVYLPDVLMKNVRSVFFSSATAKESVGV